MPAAIRACPGATRVCRLRLQGARRLAMGAKSTNVLPRSADRRGMARSAQSEPDLAGASPRLCRGVPTAGASPAGVWPHTHVNDGAARHIASTRWAGASLLPRSRWPNFRCGKPGSIVPLLPGFFLSGSCKAFKARLPLRRAWAHFPPRLPPFAPMGPGRAATRVVVTAGRASRDGSRRFAANANSRHPREAPGRRCRAARPLRSLTAPA
jgi:hypothetical protein